MKYELTDITKLCGETKLYRIRAISDSLEIGVHSGDLGGWIESKRNLSQEGNAWVYGDAMVYGNACVYEDAFVYGDARVCGDACVSGDEKVCGNACVTVQDGEVSVKYQMISGMN